MNTKQTGKAVFLFALAACLFSIAPIAGARKTASSAAIRPVSLPAYEIAKEITVEGTIRKIKMDTHGLAGTHVLVHTAQGVVDVHLGRGFASSAGRLGLFAGEPVRFIGMMARFHANSVLLARILTTSNHIYLLRNEQGIPVRALAPRANPRYARTLEEAL